MIDPFRMVFVSLISFLIVCAVALIYKFIYPKKNINLLALLILFSVPPIVNNFRPGAYESGDFTIHIYRIMSFYDSLKEGYFMPSWAAELNATYGNPLFIFNYSLSYYIISLFHFIGLSFITSMKLYLGLTFFLSGITMYVWVKALTNNKLAAFTAAVFYLFNPYHLIDTHLRATPGESTTFALAPLIFYCITKYFREKKILFLILCSLLTILLYMAHPLLAFVLIGIILIYCLFLGIFHKNFRMSLATILSLLVGIIGSCYTWISFFIYKPYMFQNPSSEVTFNPFSLLFYSPWRFGLLYQGHYGELALFLGYGQIVVVLAAIILLFLKKFSKTIRLHLLFWVMIFTIFLFLMHPASNIIWQFSPPLWMLVPFGRLLLPVAIMTSLIAAYVVTIIKIQKKKKIFYVVIILMIASTMLNWGHRTVLPEINDATLRKDVWKSTITESTTAYFLNNRWADINNFWFSELPKQHIEIVKGRGTIQEIGRNSTKHRYVLNAETPVTLKENTLYFPGWTLKSNNTIIPIYPGERGVINANLPKGLQYIELLYEDSAPYKKAKIISIITLALLIFLLLFFRFFSSNPKHFAGKP